MAKIILKNTREHDITINLPPIEKDGLPVSVTVPAARQNPENKNELLHGEVETDDSIVEAARKHTVAKHYFDEEWLRVGKPDAPKKAEAKKE